MIDVYIVGSKGIPARYGGFETFVEELTKDKEGIFKNPQDPINLPKGGGGGKPNSADEEYLDKKYYDVIKDITASEVKDFIDNRLVLVSKYIGVGDDNE